MHQLLSNQSALMYLTMGGTKTATPTIHEVNSVNDVRLGGVSSLSSRKKSHLFTTRDSGSSIGSDSSTTAAAARMRYSQNQNFSSGLSICASSVEEEVLPRSASTSSLRASLRSSSQIIKDDSSTDERDHSPSISDSTSFSMGGSRLTLNSEGGRTITESQACENMSASEPALDNPKTTTSSSLRCKQITVTSFEEGNSSDSSLNSSLPSPNSEQIKKKKWFTSSISSRLSMGKSKKKKEKELDKDKETSKQESVSIKSLDKDKESSKQESISGKA